MASIKLNLGEVNPNDIRLREAVDDTVKSTPSTTVYLYDGTQAVESKSGEPLLRLRLGEAAPEDIRLYESNDQRQTVRSVEIVLSDPTALRSGGGLATRYCQLAATEAPDVASFAAAAAIAAALETTEAPDIASLAAGVNVAAALETTEAQDIAAMSANAIVGVNLAATENPDTADLAAQAEQAEQVVTRRVGGGRFVRPEPKRHTATLRATEAPDRAAALAFVVPMISMVVAAKESPDVGSFEVMEDFTDDDLIMLLAA